MLYSLRTSFKLVKFFFFFLSFFFLLLFTVQGLTGVVPDMGRTIASKISSIALDSTNIRQCDASHLAALAAGPYAGQVDWSTTHSNLPLPSVTHLPSIALAWLRLAAS